VADLDLGVEPINTEAVVVPTEERICGFEVALTKSDFKWSQFLLTTTQRRMVISDGEFGKEAFGIMCQRVKAMFLTDEGKSVIQAMKAALKLKPLKLNTSVTEVTSV